MRKLNSFCSATLSYLHIYNFIQNSKITFKVLFFLSIKNILMSTVFILILLLFSRLFVFPIFFLIYQIKSYSLIYSPFLSLLNLIHVSQIVNIFSLKTFLQLCCHLCLKFSTNLLPDSLFVKHMAPIHKINRV